LDDLIEKCSDALYEYEGIDKGISRRTVQMDIQMMRSEKLGYNAPIVVYDSKYYKYEDSDYSITNTPLNSNDLQIMSDAVEVLRQFKGFSYFTEMIDIVNRLEDHVTSVRRKTTSVIDFEKNENLKGLEFLDIIYRAIIDKQTLEIKYRSFNACSPRQIVFYAYLLKEYRNRWFVFGMSRYSRNLYNLALDRILRIQKVENEPFVENTLFNPETFFDDVVGVTKQLDSKPETVRFWVNAVETPYIRTKPLHRSQKVVQQNEDGSAIFELNVVINFELQRDLFAYSEGLCVLAPQHLAETMRDKLRKAVEHYL
jgi:predicted DNA-binding transcriptional regulator YafY